VLDSTSELLPPTAGSKVALPVRRRSIAPRLARTGLRERPRLLAGLARTSLLGLVVLSGLLVLLAAAHPSFLTPTASSGYFPAWMAGPLGGLWPTAPPSGQAMHSLVTAILVGMYLAYLAVIVLGGRVRAGWVIGSILAIHLVFLLAPPLQYTDVFNYINFGRMGIVHHLNPYATAPVLEPKGDPAFAISNWHGILSPYGPLFTLLSYALVPLGVAGSFWALKVILCLASLGALAVIWRCAELLRRDPVRAVALVGLNPIVLVWGLGSDHNDLLMMLPLVLAVYLLARARAGARGLRLPRLGLRLEPEHLAAAAIVAAAGIKASAAVVIPVAFAAAPRRRAFVGGLLLAAAILGLVSALAFGARLPGLGSQARLVTDVGPANLLGWLLGQGGETDTLRSILSAVAAISVLAAAVLALRPDRDWLALAGVSLLAVWLTTSWFAPWYVVWILPFAALAARSRLTICLLAIGVYLLVAFGPEATALLHTLHFNPFDSALGQQHHRAIVRLVQ
jgi:hypothetical protein